MKPLGKKILIAGDGPDLSGMAEMLQQQGFELHPCVDGAKALELALTLAPDLAVVDTEVPLLPAAKLGQILRANPRTEGLDFLYVGREGEEVDGFRRRRDLFVPRPFNPEQLLARILGHFARKERTEQLSRQEKEVEGSLAQISLVDLLQVFGLNHKDGVLTLHRGSERGTIYLLGGAVVNARCARVEAEKAFYRLLGWEEGQFSFRPMAVDTEPRIAAPMDHLLMEGLRQNDEMHSQADRLPPLDAELVLKIPRDRLPRGLRPATQEILLLLEYPHRVGELLDHSARPDYEILQILRVLIDKGLVEQRTATPVTAGPQALLSADEVLLIKDRLGERDNLLEEASAKLLLLTSGPAQLREFLRVLQGMPEFRPESGLSAPQAKLELGDLGRLELADTFHLRLFVLPAGGESAPLWKPFCRRLLGVVSLCDNGTAAEATDYFCRRERVPVAAVSFNESVPGTFLLRPGERQVWRELFTYFLKGLRPVEPAREPA